MNAPSSRGHRSLVLVALLLGLFVVATGAASAGPLGLSYVYQGNPYNLVEGPFTASDFLTGTALIDFTGAGTYAATTWSLSTTAFLGTPFTITSLTPGVNVKVNEFVLDAAGNIDFWALAVDANVIGDPLLRETLETFNPSIGPGLHDFALLDFDGPGCDRGCEAVGTGTAGTWTLVTSVPEPASITLFGLGLGMAGLFGWVRRR